VLVVVVISGSFPASDSSWIVSLNLSNLIQIKRRGSISRINREAMDVKSLVKKVLERGAGPAATATRLG
jgi:hypothetical protein